MPTRIIIYDPDVKEWRELPESPFPVSIEGMAEVREKYSHELEKAGNNPFATIRQAPQTYVRSLLKERFPMLSDFDLMALGFAVVNTKIKMEKE